MISIPDAYHGEDWSDVHSVNHPDYNQSWMLRDNACKQIAHALRQHLLSQFFGKPVMAVRNRQEEIQQNNSDFVNLFMEKKELKYSISWKVSYEYFVKDGMPIITDFNVVVN